MRPTVQLLLDACKGQRHDCRRLGHFAAPMRSSGIQSRVKAFLQGFGLGLLKYCAILLFLGWAAERFECDSQNLAGMFLHNSVEQNLDKWKKHTK